MIVRLSESSIRDGGVTRSLDGGHDVEVEVVGVRIVGNELGDLNSSDEIFVGIRHNVVVLRLSQSNRVSITAIATKMRTDHRCDLGSFPLAFVLHHFVFSNSHLDAPDQFLSCDSRQLRFTVDGFGADSSASLLEESLQLSGGEGRVLDVLIHGEVLELLLDRGGSLRLTGERREEGTEHAVGRRNILELGRRGRLRLLHRRRENRLALLRVRLLMRRWDLLERLRRGERLLLDRWRSASLVEHLCFDFFEREGSPSGRERLRRGVAGLGGGSLFCFDVLESPSDGLGGLRVLEGGRRELLRGVEGVRRGGEARGEGSAGEEGIGIEGAVGGESGLQVAIRRASKVKVPSWPRRGVRGLLEERRGVGEN